MEQTPIQKAVYLLGITEIDLKKKGADNRVLLAFSQAAQIVTSVLEEEKQFAKDAFEASKKKDPLGNEGIAVWTNFNDYYKKYES